jgi:cytoskeletal protein RodZ
MKTVGIILKDARTAKKISLEQAETATKIRKKFLLALEHDDLSVLPSQSYAKGFIRNYSTYLGLDPQTVLAFFRRQTREISQISIIPKGVDKPLNQSLVRLTPSRFMGLLAAGLMAIFLIYFGFQYRRLEMPPMLTVESPVDQASVTEKRVEVKGKTDPDSTLTINGVTVIIRTDGKYFDLIGLSEGNNVITITSTSRYGKKKTITRNVKYNP